MSFMVLLEKSCNQLVLPPLRSPGDESSHSMWQTSLVGHLEPMSPGTVEVPHLGVSRFWPQTRLTQSVKQLHLTPSTSRRGGLPQSCHLGYPRQSDRTA
ncbi:hypothetical protein O181_046685 [Austropuccinia psidii MF-1]|uniref:Uncharacterized protein n=1 Tax=Austropuccinia psidii MF-1 TaxID=1389203 RepID=A0A9Q3DNZ0_9BASI|nr:hypothetical protein [Austropuccinia psidii MF-1]